MATIVSKRQKEKFTSDGFIYIFDRMSACGSKIFWRCERKDYCKARIHTQNGIVVKTINKHLHDSSAAKVEVDLAVTRMKRRIEEETPERTSQVIDACLDGISEGALGAMPNQGALRKIIQRRRNVVQAVPPAPESVVDLIIPDRYKVYEPQAGIQENFLLADSGQVPGRILIFGRERNLRVSICFCFAVFNILNFKKN